MSLSNGDGSTTLVPKGRLVGPWVEELRRSCEQPLSSWGDLTLDLGTMSFDRHVRLTNCSLFVAERLRTPER